MVHVEMSPEAIATQKPYLDLGLTEAEYDRFAELIGHQPNDTEIGLASGMWSEHCAYKYSKPVLRQFWTKNERVLMGPGEGAGVIDIGEGKAVVFKAESHNHPSAVEPYEGAATGVGGIIRDIFSIGAKPVAMLDSLAFGDIEQPHTQHLVDRIVAGIGGYGNAIGIPTVGGETNFDGSYTRNPLVNAMCVGIMDKDQIQKGKAAGVGNALIYVGAKTGRDGINGASFASGDFSDEEAADRSAVQVGDPFMEKLLMDACLEITRHHQEALVGIQDMGAAGLLSSSSEMAAKAGMGIHLNLDMVPQRETGMTPYELMLSESQERMVLVVKKGEEQAIIDLFQSADLDAVIIGQVTDDGRYRLNFKNEVVADVPVDFLTHAPKQDLPMIEPARLANFTDEQFEPDMANVKETILTLLAQPTIASKASLFRHFDSQVRADTAIKPGGDAALIRIRDTQKALAMTTDVNARYLYLNPRVGAKMAVAEAARNIVSTGAKPIGITDGLNFGSPDNPEVYYELDQAVAGINDVAKQLDTPIISGNVSLYNETDGQAIYPTPMIGMVGLLEDITKATRTAFQKAGDNIYLVGRTKDSFNGSEIQKMQTGHIAGQLFDFNDEDELAAQQVILDVTDQRLLNSAHDLSEGGLIVGLLESAFAGNLGFDISVDLADKYLFSETPSRFVVSVSPENRTTFESLAGDRVIKLGVVTADDTINITTTTSDIQLSFSETKKIYQESIAWKLNAE